MTIGGWGSSLPPKVMLLYTAETLWLLAIKPTNDFGIQKKSNINIMKINEYMLTSNSNIL
jgi:hypothetical protein